MTRRRESLARTAVCLAVAVAGVGIVALGSEAVRAEEEATSLEERLAEIESRVARGEIEEALDQLEGWVAEAGTGAADHSALQARLGNLYVSAGEPYAALQHLEAVAQERGEATDQIAYADALLAVARSHLTEGRAASVQVLPYLLDAIEAATLAGDEPAVLPERHRIEGEARYWMGELDEALAAWGRIPAGALAEEAARRVRELEGHALYGLGRFEDAAAVFREIGNPRAEASAWAAARKGRETAEVYGHLLAQAPGDETLHEEAWRSARYVGAEQELREVLDELEAPPGSDALGVLLLYRGLLAEATGDEETALRVLRDAAAASPGRTRPLVELGRLRLSRAGGADETGRDRAVDAFLAALTRDPEDERTLAFLWAVAGQDYAAAWRSPPALERSLRIQRALVEASPDDGLALGNAGNTLRVAGRLDEALATYDRAREAEPSDPAIASDRGLVLSALGRRAEALDAFLDAARLDPAYDAARQNAARWLWRAGRDGDATAQLAAGLEVTRASGRGAMRYRFLLDRAWRTARNEALR